MQDPHLHMVLRFALAAVVIGVVIFGGTTMAYFAGRDTRHVAGQERAG